MRLDIYLVENKLADSRSHAQELIAAEQVIVIHNNQTKKATKASLKVESGMQVIVEDGPANKFVSRGGHKLDGALKHVGISVQDLKALDVGTSTGGFSDCLLQNGVSSVVGVDVGHGQLSPKLQNNPKLKLYEGINARSLSSQAFVKAEKFDLIVMDVSFISITLILPELVNLLSDEGTLLSLVKPQFEVGIDGLSKGGIVKDKSLYAEVEVKIRRVCSDAGFVVKDYFSSSIEGKDGNHEFFVFAKKK